VLHSVGVRKLYVKMA